VKRILVNTSWIFLVLFALSASAQDELSGEIDKLESGQVESESPVAEDPSQSAQDIENELNEEFGIPNQKNTTTPTHREEAPEEIPEEIAGPQEEAAPVVEETQSPDEFNEVESEEKTAEPETPVQIGMEDSLTPVEEDVVQEEPVEQTPEPVVEETPATPEPAPYVEPAQPEPSYAESVPDDFEERMHRIYSQFYTEATSESTWTQIAGEKIKETYTVQPGDTLWDISVTFFGNGHYWPKVWQMNDSITNPHMISAGYVLKFVPGQIDSAPQLRITESGETELVPGTTELATKIEDPNASTAGLEPVIPPPEKRHVPVLTDLPPSLPYIRGAESEGYDKDGFDLQLKAPKIQSAKVYLTSYLTEEKPVSAGKIVEMSEEDGETATLYETVFVQMDGGARIGEKVTVYSLGPRAEDTAGRGMGYPVIQEGEVQIQELVNQKDNVYKGMVVRSIGTAKVGSFVSRAPLAVGNISDSRASNPINAEVVGGAFDADRKVMGYQDVVYLNKGSNEGFKEGQVFTVLKSMRDRKKSTMVGDLREQVARIKILKTTPQRATAIVLNSNFTVRPGDFIGTQANLPKPEELKSIRERENSYKEKEISDATPETEQDLDLEESELE